MKRIRNELRSGVLVNSICIAMLLASATNVSSAEKPNVVIFLADDLGYADVGVNGCQDIPTPNVDSIAKNGVRFTDGYAAHFVCSPSWAALMSGLYPHRFGFEHNSGPERFADPNFGMPRSVPSLAEKLKTAGHATGMIGEWHIGFKEGLRPHERGFDYHFGFLSGAHTYLPGREDNDAIVRNGETVKTTKLKELQAAFAEWEKDKMSSQWVRQVGPTAEAGGKRKANSPTGAAAAANANSRIATALKTADKDGDGKLSASEYPQPELFKSIDTDADGFASSEEIRAYYAGRTKKGTKK